MSEIRKRAERNSRVRRTISTIEQTVSKLEKMKDEYMQKAVDARARGETASYNLAKSGLNATLTQLKRAKEMLLNIKITAELQRMGESNTDFLKGMSVIAKSICKVNKKSDFVKLQKEIANALSGLEEAQAGLDGFLQNSDAAFAAISSGNGSLSDHAIDELVTGKMSEREVFIDADLDRLMQTRAAMQTQASADGARVAAGGDSNKAEEIKPLHSVDNTRTGQTVTNGAEIPIEQAPALMFGFDGVYSGADKTLLSAIDALALTECETAPALRFCKGDGVRYFTFSDTPHVLICGENSARICAESVLLSAAATEPYDFRIVYCDLTDAPHVSFNGMAHLACNVVTDKTAVNGMAEQILQLTMSRFDEFASCGVSDIDGYRAHNGKMPSVLFVVNGYDRIADMSRFGQTMAKLSIFSKSAGVYSLIACDGVTEQNYTKQIASILALRAAANLPGEQSVMLFGDERANGIGTDIIAESEILQAANLTAAAESTLLNALKAGVV